MIPTLGQYTTEIVKGVRSRPLPYDDYVVPVIDTYSGELKVISEKVITPNLISSTRLISGSEFVAACCVLIQSDSIFDRPKQYLLSNVVQKQSHWPMQIASVSGGMVCYVLPTAYQAYQAFLRAKRESAEMVGYIKPTGLTSHAARVYYISAATLLVRLASQRDYIDYFDLVIVDDVHATEPALYTVLDYFDQNSVSARVAYISSVYKEESAPPKPGCYGVTDMVYHPVPAKSWPSEPFESQPWHRRSIKQRTAVLCPDDSIFDSLRAYYSISNIMVVALTVQSNLDEVDAVTQLLATSCGKPVVLLTVPSVIVSLDLAIDVLIDTSEVITGPLGTDLAYDKYRPISVVESKRHRDALGKVVPGIYCRAMIPLADTQRPTDSYTQTLQRLWMVYLNGVSASAEEMKFSFLERGVTPLGAAHMLNSYLPPCLVQHYLDSSGAVYVNVYPAFRHYSRRHSDMVSSFVALKVEQTTDWTPVPPTADMLGEVYGTVLYVPTSLDSFYAKAAEHIAFQSLALVRPAVFNLIDDQSKQKRLLGAIAAAVPGSVRRNTSLSRHKGSSKKRILGMVREEFRTDSNTIPPDYSYDSAVISDVLSGYSAEESSVTSDESITSVTRQSKVHYALTGELSAIRETPVYNDLTKLPAPLCVKPCDSESSNDSFMTIQPKDLERVNALLKGSITLDTLDQFDQRLLHNAFIRVWNSDILARRIRAHGITDRKNTSSARKFMRAVTEARSSIRSLREDRFQRMLSFYKTFGFLGFQVATFEVNLDK